MVLVCITLSFLLHSFLLFSFIKKEEVKTTFFPLETLLFKKDHLNTAQASPSKNINSQKRDDKESISKSSLVPSDSPSVASGTSAEGEFIEAQALQSLEPEYPEFSRRKGEEGISVVRAKIAATGLVENVTLEKSSGFKHLDQSALEQVKQTKFSPAKKGLEAIYSEKKIVFNFTLKK